MPITIADLHGRLDLLDAVLGYFPPDTEYVFLGDATDRGENSRGVIERLSALADANRVTLLRGNHEQMLLSALDMLAKAKNSRSLRLAAQSTFSNWLRNGGDKVVDEFDGFDIDTIPASLQAYVGRTVLEYRFGRVLCTHAAPRTTLAKYGPGEENAMLWARPDEGPFPLPEGIEASVHGHTPLSTPTWVRRHLYTDLGAVHTGALCTVDLESLELNEPGAPAFGRVIVFRAPSDTPLEALPYLASNLDGLIRTQDYQTVPAVASPETVEAQDDAT